MEHQRQLKIDNCGQTCIAMITGVSQYDAMNAAGRDGGLSTAEIKETLWNFGFEVELRRGRKGWPPPLAILFTHTPGAVYGHAVVLRDGIVHDPEFSTPFDLDFYEQLLDGYGTRIVNYLAVGKRRF